MKMRSPANPARWEDPAKRGNCLCRATDAQCRELLASKGLKGIEYVDYEPQFGPVSEASVSIPHMTRFRNTVGSWSDPSGEAPVLGNFQQADREAARLWNAQGRDGRRDWTARDVEKYRKENKLTWHERYDNHSMDLIPRCIHRHFTHTGGVAFRKWVESILAANEDNPDTFEDMPRSEHQPEKDGERSVRSQGGFCPLQVILTVACIGLLVTTYCLADCSGALHTLMWLAASAVPYAVVAGVCLRWKFLRKLFTRRFGGIVLLAIFLVLHFFVPGLTEIFFGLACAAVGWWLLKAVGSFGPDGTLTIVRENGDGTTSTETRAYYGSSADAVARAERDLRAEGYDNIRHTG